MLPVKSIMTEEVIWVTPQTPIYEALHLLTEHKISGLPVVDEDRHVVGILSEKDVLAILLDKHPDAKKTVSNYMSRDVISFTEDASAIDICKFFIQSNIRRVPIIRDNKLVGIVSRRDIVSLILEVKTKMSDFRFS